jgi:hypothetical protein
LKKAISRLLDYSIDFLILGLVLVGVQLILKLATNGFPFDDFSGAKVEFE